MLDLAITVTDRTVAPAQYRYVETHAWWLGSFGAHQHLTEHRLRQWVPARTDRHWVLDRVLTGAQTWLTGSAEAARAEGFDLRDVAPTGRFRALHGDFRSVDRDPDDLGDPAGLGDLTDPGDLGDGFDEPGCGPTRPARRGSWQSPTAEFWALLPRDPAVLLTRLREDNPGSWFGPFTAAVTALRTGLVPADLRGALYRAVTGLPDVSVAEEVHDVDGRALLALVHDAGRTRTELMISPVDGQFAGERDTLRTGTRCGLGSGTVISSTAVTTAVVDAEGAIPA